MMMMAAAAAARDFCRPAPAIIYCCWRVERRKRWLGSCSRTSSSSTTASRTRPFGERMKISLPPAAVTVLLRRSGSFPATLSSDNPRQGKTRQYKTGRVGGSAGDLVVGGWRLPVHFASPSRLSNKKIAAAQITVQQIQWSAFALSKLRMGICDAVRAQQTPGRQSSIVQTTVTATRKRHVRRPVARQRGPRFWALGQGWWDVREVTSERSREAGKGSLCCSVRFCLSGRPVAGSLARCGVLHRRRRRRRRRVRVLQADVSEAVPERACGADAAPLGFGRFQKDHRGGRDALDAAPFLGELLHRQQTPALLFQLRDPGVERVGVDCAGTRGTIL
jgi:hypothetical protein